MNPQSATQAEMSKRKPLDMNDLINRKLKPLVLTNWHYLKHAVWGLPPKEKLHFFSHYIPMERVIRIPLNDLNHYATESAGSYLPLKGHQYFCDSFIKDGDWDLNTKPILPGYYDNHRWFRSTFQYFAEGLPLEQCDEYLMCSTSHRPKKRKKYKQLETLFQAMRIDGYKSQQELGVAPKPMYHKYHIDEVNVAIDREGRFLRVRPAGNHRLAMAMILKIESIPVYVRGVHREWAKYLLYNENQGLRHAINKALQAMNKHAPEA